MEIIGEGGYGCVISPAIDCDGKQLPNKVSKVGVKSDIEEEYRKYRLIELADKHAEYYIGKPNYVCLPDSKEFITTLNKCDMFRDKKLFDYNIDLYAQLIMNYGGVTLGKYIKSINKLTPNSYRKYLEIQKMNEYYDRPEVKKHMERQYQNPTMLKNLKLHLQESEGAKNTIIEKLESAKTEEEREQGIKALEDVYTTITKIQKLLEPPNLKQPLPQFSEKDQETINNIQNKVERMFVNIYTLFLGIDVFVKTRIIHRDIKPLNIIYDEEANRMYFIDFGLMTSFSEIINNKSKNLNMYNNPREQKFYVDFENETSTKKLKDTLDYMQDEARHIFDDLFENKYVFDEETVLEQYETMINKLQPDDKMKKLLMTKSLPTFDLYGLGYTLFTIINQLEFSCGQLNLDILELCKQMMNWNVFDRISVKQAMVKYEQILKRNGLLDKYDICIKRYKVQSKHRSLRTLSASKTKRRSKTRRINSARV